MAVLTKSMNEQKENDTKSRIKKKTRMKEVPKQKKRQRWPPVISSHCAMSIRPTRTSTNTWIWLCIVV